MTLTKHTEGSIRELWHISLPLMISTLASLLMIFVDRMFLARYSSDSLNAAVGAGTWAWAFFCGMGMLTAMSEVFVAQYNGSKNYSKIGVPVWQMIWAALVSFFLFIPIGLFIGPKLYAGSIYETMQVQYFGWLMLFGPFYALMTALSGFYIGRGKTRLLIGIAIIANLLNIILDRLLIFGAGPFPEMGIKGAAIATCFGHVFQAFILLFLFLRKKNRDLYQTHNYRFNAEVFRKCLKIGLPQGLFMLLEIAGFGVFYQLMTTLSPEHITISSICQSILILVSFYFDGLGRGVTAVAGNFIGAGRFDRVKSVLRSALTLQLIFTASIFLIFAFNTRTSLSYLFPEILSIDFTPLWFCLLIALAYIAIEGVRWIFSGILTAAGDTLFLLIAGASSVWGLLILPVYLFVVGYRLDVTYAWLLCLLYTVIATSIYAYRFRSGKWREINLVKETEEENPLFPDRQKTE